jgi:anti-sigma factor RsiW
MNGCSAVQARFTEYLDGRLNGREMQRIAAHLEDCRECAGSGRRCARRRRRWPRWVRCRSPRTCCCGFAWR